MRWCRPWSCVVLQSSRCRSAVVLHPSYPFLHGKIHSLAFLPTECLDPGMEQTPELCLWSPAWFHPPASWPSSRCSCSMNQHSLSHRLALVDSHTSSQQQHLCLDQKLPL